MFVRYCDCLQTTITIPIAASVRAKDCEVIYTPGTSVPSNTKSPAAGGDGAGGTASGGAEDDDADAGHLLVKICDEVYIDAALTHCIISDDFTWTIETDSSAPTGTAAGAVNSGKVLSIFLPKRKQLSWWSAALKTHPRVNTAEISPENAKLNDLDKHTRAMVEKMMYEQRLKAIQSKAPPPAVVGSDHYQLMKEQQQQSQAALAAGSQAGAPKGMTEEQQKAFAEFQKLHPEMDFSQAKFM